jgi:hypothetical protein
MIDMVAAGGGGTMGEYDHDDSRADGTSARAGAATALTQSTDIFAAAWRAGRALLRDPVAGIGIVHAGIARERLFAISAVFALVAAAGLALAGGLMIRAMLGGIATAYGAGFGFDAGAFLRSTLVYLLTILAAGGGVLVVARAAPTAIAGSSAVFIAAAAFLPAGLASLAGALIAAVLHGRLGMYVASLLLLAGGCYLVMVLNAGLRRVAMMDESRAAPTTVGVLAIALTAGSLVASIF